MRSTISQGIATVNALACRVSGRVQEAQPPDDVSPKEWAESRALDLVERGLT